MAAVQPLFNHPFEDKPDERSALTERIVLVTGASSGLGLALH